MTLWPDSAIEAAARAMMDVRAAPPGTDGTRELPVLDLDPDFDDLPLDHTQGTEDDPITQVAVLKLARAALSTIDLAGVRGEAFRDGVEAMRNVAADWHENRQADYQRRVDREDDLDERNEWLGMVALHAEFAVRVRRLPAPPGTATPPTPDPRDAEIVRLREALADARAFVSAELDVRVDSHTLGGDMATLDDDDQGIVGEAMDCLARIDAALATGPDGGEAG